MKSIVILTFLCLCFSGLALGSLQSYWMSFKEQHGKVYKDEAEEKMRQEIFTKKLKMVQDFNLNSAKSAGYKMGINHMSDWTEEERARVNGYKPSLRRRNRIMKLNSRKFIESILNDNSKPVPEAVDWRKVPGRVTPVKDQGTCGSCWSFATTGLLEGQEAYIKHNLTSLSEQNLIDCSKDNYGCGGGDMTLALEFIQREGGIDDEKSYPYKGENGECKYNKKHSVMTIEGPAILGPGDLHELKVVVARYGPVAVAVEASSKFQDYESGIFNDPFCSHALNHGVLIVGYGTTPEGVDYWIVKNSWGQTWGHDGYLLMSRNNTKCGITDDATVVIL